MSRISANSPVQLLFRQDSGGFKSSSKISQQSLPQFKRASEVV